MSYFRVVPLDVRLFVLLLLNALLIDNEIALSRSHIIPLDDATFSTWLRKMGGGRKEKISAKPITCIFYEPYKVHISYSDGHAHIMEIACRFSRQDSFTAPAKK